VSRTELGLFMATRREGGPVVAVDAKPRVFAWFAESAKDAGVRILVETDTSQRGMDYGFLERNVALPFRLTPVAAWRSLEDGKSSGLNLCTASAEVSPEQMLALKSEGLLFGSRDIQGGAVVVELALSDTDHLRVASVAVGRAVEFYIDCAGACRESYELSTARLAAESRRFRVLSSQATQHEYTATSPDGTETARLFVKPSSIGGIRHALDLVVDLWAGLDPRMTP